MPRMVIHHLTGNIEPDAGGPAYSIPRLCEMLREHGDSVELLTLRGSYEHQVLTSHRSFDVGILPNKLGHSPEMWRWLRNSMKKFRPDILHSHNLWRMPSIYPTIESLRWRVPHVVSPRGTLTPYSMSTGSIFKRVFWPSIQRPALKLAAGFHATASSELQDIRRLGFTQPVAVIPNGVELPARQMLNLEPDRPKTILFFGRLHPEKGLINLLLAWGSTSGAHPDWRLLLAGPDPVGHKSELERLVVEQNIPRVYFEGPKYGDDKLEIYRKASIYVLPSPSENFGLTVAEALSMSLPVIANKGAPWEGLNTQRCGWWIESDVNALADALDIAMRKHPLELIAMGLRGRHWMNSDFSWPEIARKMNLFYRFILKREPQPSFVYMS